MLKISLKQAESALDLVIKSNRVPNLVGTTGIGKTELIKGFASKRDWMVKTITCSLMQEGDLMLPIPKFGDKSDSITEVLQLVIEATNVLQSDKKEELQVFISNKLREIGVNNQNESGLNTVIRAIDEDIVELIKYLEGHPERHGILFLDELNRASVAVQAELMNLVLARELKGTSLPDNCHIVIAMNPDSSMEGFSETNYAVNAGDAAINNRLVSFYLNPTLEDWVEWGYELNSNNQTNVDPRVMDFLTNQIEAESFFNMPEDSGTSIGTPRSWKAVSDILRVYDTDTEAYSKIVLQSTIQGTVGDKPSMQLMLFLDNYQNLITVKDVFNTEDTLSQETITRFKQSSEIAKKTLMRNLMLKLDNDLKRKKELEDIGVRIEDTPSFEYINHFPVRKFCDLMVELNKKSKDNAFDLFRQMYSRPTIWEFCKNCDNAEFSRLAIEASTALT